MGGKGWGIRVLSTLKMTGLPLLPGNPREGHNEGTSQLLTTSDNE